ncbi:MAG: long-chain-acyl-CoA synthetase, partial [Pseudomonadota bacterium]
DCIKYNATSFGYVGELCRYLYDQEPSPKDRQHKVYKIVGNGLRPAIWREFKARFGIERIHEFYASSEGNVGFSNLFNFDYTVGFTPKVHKMVKYDVETSQPIRGSDGFLVEVDKLEPGLMIGLISEDAPFDGYTDPEKTKKTIIEDAFESGDRWFNSGDVMRSIGFNHAQFVDRLGDTFRWKGENVSTTEVESILEEFDQITNVVTYGVEISNTNGRAGMSALNLDVAEDAFDWSKLFEFAQENLPSYAIPVFVRVRKDLVDTTGTFKYKKADLKKEAYYTDQCQGDAVYVLLPGEKTYTKLDMELAEKIDAGAFRF